MPHLQIAHFTSPRYWTIAPAVCLGSIAAAAAILAYLLWVEISTALPQVSDGAWSVSELGYEHNRLLLAAEKGESVQDIAFYGDLYLSRVTVFRESRNLVDVRKLVPEGDLWRFYRSVQVTSHLIAGLDGPDGRAALLTQLRADARPVRDLVLRLSQLDRKVKLDQQAEQKQVLVRYMTSLLLLLMTLFVARFIINFKLREAGRALTAQLATREGILASVDAAILGLCARGEVLYSNHHARKLLGPSADTGASFTEAAADRGSLLSEIASIVGRRNWQGAGEWNDMRKIRIDDGTVTRHYTICITSAQPTIPGYKQGTLAAFIVVITDVTTEEEAARRREEYDARLGEASQVLAYAAMSGGIIHEISQPLAAMRNYIYTLKATMDPTARDEHQVIAGLLGVEIDRAIEVVRTIREMGPPGPKDIEICDVHEVIAQSIRLVSLGASTPPPITVTPAEQEVVITGSLPVIGQVVVNLLKNALSASSAAGRSGARVDIRLVEDKAEIAVADFGTGVSEDAARSMFAPFSKSARGGMGLGLAICQRIASDLGGSLSWENDHDAGAVFRFRVPLACEGALQ